MLKGIGEGATYFYHPDHLGSVSVVSNHKGEPYERVEYLPFGEVWIEDVDPATRYIPFRFTSKELDRETGLYYYGARYYEPKVSRWMSADPAGFALINPMEPDEEGGWQAKASYSVIEATNWYSYTSNNPVKYVDPEGLWTFSLGLFVSGSAGLSGKTEGGIAFGFDKEQKILSMGIYSTIGVGGAAGGGISGGGTVTVTGNDSVRDLEGESITSGGSGGFLYYLGFDYSMPLESDASLKDSAISISAGTGLSAEAHVLISDTEITGFEIDIPEVTEKINEGFKKFGEAVNEGAKKFSEAVNEGFKKFGEAVKKFREAKAELPYTM